MKYRIFAALVLALVSGAALAQTCPFNIPVVTIPPHQMNGYSWGAVIRPPNGPTEDACLQHIAVDPTNDNAWYVGAFSGLYMTKTGAQSWTKPLLGNVGALYIVPGLPQLVYAGIDNKLFLTRDAGTTWTLIKTFTWPVRSILVVNGTLYVGLGWGTHAVLSGVYSMNLGGGGMQFLPFPLPVNTGLIVWTLSHDPLSGAIYAGTEIYDHPQPYTPKFFRRWNNAWTDQTGTLPWHVVASAVRPTDGYVYALTEGYGVYGSATMGGNWTPPQPAGGLGVSLLMDPVTPTRLWAGRQKFQFLNGGAFLSTDGGLNFTPIGVAGATVADIALSGGGTRIYVAAYASGIYISAVP